MHQLPAVTWVYGHTKYKGKRTFAFGEGCADGALEGTLLISVEGHPEMLPPDILMSTSPCADSWGHILALLVWSRAPVPIYHSSFA